MMSIKFQVSSLFIHKNKMFKHQEQCYSINSAVGDPLQKKIK